MKRIFLITGSPGVGKTTLIKKVSEKLKLSKIAPFTGFYTEEMRDENKTRIGFNVIEIGSELVAGENKTASLARLTEMTVQPIRRNLPKVGKYSVTLDTFEEIALPTISSLNERQIYIIDEIGKMELFSSKFKNSINQLIDLIEKSDQILLLATIPSSQSVTFDIIERLRNHHKGIIHTVTFQNRNNLVDQVYEEIVNSCEFKN